MIKYQEWTQSQGMYRWYHEDGSPRTTFELNHNWKAVYDKVTRDCDIAFIGRHISDCESFTASFLSMVPINWLRYKSALEMLTGAMDGDNIDINLFSAGYTRTTDGWDDSDIATSSTGTSNQTIDTSLGQRTDTSSSDLDSTDIGNQDVNMAQGTDKVINDGSRSIMYDQGVQAYDNFDSEIGANGNDFASGFNDAINKSNSTEDVDGLTTTTSNDIRAVSQDIENVTGRQNNSTEDVLNTQNDADSYRLSKRGEIVKETRVNMYDNIAFLRMRVELEKNIKPFHEYFFECFEHVESMAGFWSDHFSDRFTYIY